MGLMLDASRLTIEMDSVPSLDRNPFDVKTSADIRCTSLGRDDCTCVLLTRGWSVVSGEIEGVLFCGDLNERDVCSDVHADVSLRWFA